MRHFLFPLGFLLPGIKRCLFSLSASERGRIEREHLHPAHAIKESFPAYLIDETASEQPDGHARARSCR